MDTAWYRTMANSHKPNVRTNYVKSTRLSAVSAPDSVHGRSYSTMSVKETNKKFNQLTKLIKDIEDGKA